MASVGGFGKILGIIGVVVMMITSILLWVYGIKIKDNKEITNKTNTGNTLIAFGVMNIVFGLLMLIPIFFGCKEYAQINYDGA
jgi:multisubunit Na+/H+ antiporter MnhB subunit